MTTTPTPIAVATEDQLSEAIALRLIAEMPKPLHVTAKLRRGGFGYLRSKMTSWQQMGQYQVMLVLTDLDQANCVVDFRDQWLGDQPSSPGLLLRVAVRQIESWVLADHLAMRALIGTKGVLPREPDTLSNPKQTLLALAQRAPRPVRDDLVTATGGDLKQGLGYNARLTHWVNTHWCPHRAAERSPSLARASGRLSDLVRAFKS